MLQIQVSSGHEEAELGGYHVSVSLFTAAGAKARPLDEQMEWVKLVFELEDCHEDNSHGQVWCVRHLWQNSTR